MKRRGERVYTAAMGEGSVGSISLHLGALRSLLSLAMFVAPRRIDQVSFQYVDGFIEFGPGPYRRQRLVRLVQLAVFLLLKLKSRGRLTLIVHEFLVGRHAPYWEPHRRRLMRLADRLEFHTETERAAFVEDCRQRGVNLSDRTAVVAHDRYFSPHYAGSKAQAREELGLPETDHIFLCIGFIQAHKAFDEAMRAFRTARATATSPIKLYVVGSMRVDEPQIRRYRDTLRRLAAEIEGCEFVEAFTSDREFDQWIKAADCVILPYREIWSSGVGARARLLGVRLLSRRHDNLLAQFSAEDDVSFFETEAELAASMNRVADQASPEAAAMSPSSRAEPPRVLYVAPYFGLAHPGGAEKVDREFAALLSRSGCDVEVWACDTDRFSPRNHGVARSSSSPEGLKVRYFRTNAFVENIWNRCHREINRGRGNFFVQWLWRRTGIYGHGMHKALKENVDQFEAIILPHNFYGSTHRLASVAPTKTIVHPYFHNDAALRLDVFADLYASVRTVLLNSEEELDAAEMSGRISPIEVFVAGNVVERQAVAIDGGNDDALLSAHGLQSGEYVLYVGRLTPDKNVDDLLDWHADFLAMTGARLPLVLVGMGPMDAELRRRKAEGESILLLQGIESGELDVLQRNSLCLINVSILESFSLVVMESLGAGRPVIVHAGCEPVAGHVERSGGGLLVSDGAGYARALERLAFAPTLAARLGENGRRYVEAQFTSEKVAARLVEVVRHVQRSAVGAPA